MASTINASSSGAGGLISTGDSSGVLQLQSNTSPTVTVDASGNVGIGTSSPSNILDVYKTQDAETSIGLSNTSTGVNAQVRTKYTTNAGLLTVGTTGTAHVFGGDAYVWQVANKGIRFATNDTERMRIDSSGNVLIGMTTYATTPTQGISFQNSTYPSVNIGHASGTASGFLYVNFGYNGTQIGSITQNGTTAVAFNTTSDYRLKENVEPMTGALNKVTQLNPVTYTWKSDGSTGQGFIAHELQSIVPECVVGEKDAVDAEGNPKYQGIDTSYLVATLTAAIQELKAIVDKQQQEINALKGAK